MEPLATGVVVAALVAVADAAVAVVAAVGVEGAVVAAADVQDTKGFERWTIKET